MADWSRYRVNQPNRWSQYRVETDIPRPSLPELPSIFDRKLPKSQPTRSVGFNPFSPDFTPIKQAVGERAGAFAEGFLQGPGTSEESWQSPYGKAGVAIGAVTGLGIGGKLAKTLFKGKKAKALIPEVLPPEPTIIPGKRRLGAAPEPKGLLGPAIEPEVIPKPVTLEEGARFIAGPRGVAEAGREYQTYLPPTTTTFAKGKVNPKDIDRIAADIEADLVSPDLAASYGVESAGRQLTNSDKMLAHYRTVYEHVIQRGFSPQLADAVATKLANKKFPAQSGGNVSGANWFDSPTYSGPMRAELEPPVPGKRVEVLPPKEPFVSTYPQAGRTTTITNPKGKKAQQILKAQAKTNIEQTTPVTESRLAWKDKLDEWYNARKARDLEAKKASDPFKKYDVLGFDAIRKSQAGQGFDDVKKYFDTKYQEVKNFIPELKYRQNYLPQLWDNTAEEIALAFPKGRTVSKRPGFSLERVLEDYDAGIAQGLTPKYDKISDLVGWYEQSANKAVADRQLFDYLKNSGLLRPTAKVKGDPNYASLNPDYFPQLGGKNQGMSYSVPKDIAKTINNLLEPEGGFLHTLAKPFRFTKNIALTGGVPGTGINWHGLVNLPARSFASAGLTHPIEGVKRLTRSLYFDVNPAAAQRVLDTKLDNAIDATKHGLSLGAEGFWAGKEPAENLVGKIEGWFGDATFKKILPATKLSVYDDLWPQLVKKGLVEKEAKKQAAQYTNHMFGGGALDPKLDKQVRSAMDIAFLAPDWFATKYQIGKEAVKALKNPANPIGRQYLNSVGAMIATLVGTSALRYGLSGKEPPTSRRVGNVPLPALDYPDKTAELDPTGAAFDTVEFPMRIANEVRKGNVPVEEVMRTVRSNTSIPLQTLWSFIDEEDYFGRPLTNKDRFGNDVPTKEFMANIIGEILGNVTPQTVQGPFDAATGRLKPLEGLATGLELPVRWYKKPRKVLPQVSRP